jgi:hypothetical protein
VSAHRTAWHFFFTILLRRRGSHAFEIRDEVPLSEERPRLDYLLLRKRPDLPDDEPAQSLRGLWRRLPLVTIAEFKSIGRPYRRRELDRLWGYVHLHCADEQNGLEKREEICALLIVPARTPTLDGDTAEMGLVWEDLGDGYWQLHGGLLRLYVAELDVVAEQEHDSVLQSFGNRKERTPEAVRFWAEQVGTKEARMTMQDMEGYEEIVHRFLELIPPAERVAGLAPAERVAGLAPAERVAGLAPAERVADLTPEQVLLTLPDGTLRVLPDEYLATLSEPTRAEIRRRIGR